MNAERWQRVKELLHQAMQLGPEQRARFLDSACALDSSLRAEVQSLLVAEESVRSTFLQSATPTGTVAAFAALQPMTRLPPSLGPYEILGPIARGGMGEVYRARDTRLRRYVAVKILPADLSRDPSRQLRFEREARAASALNHPNIVTVYDIGCESGIPFIVSEFIEGESLRGLIARGPVPAAQVVEIAIQLAAGLGAAHAAGIVHRDLKPENIMRMPDQRVKILDFGLAKHIEQPLDAPGRARTLAITAPGMVMGTVGYLSPEQVRSEQVDQRSDIFSLGAVLYELAAGRRAFPGGNVVDIIRAILNAEPAALGANVPPLLDGVIRRCLQKNAELRFQNAASLAVALKSIGEISAMRRVLWEIERKPLLLSAPAAILVAWGIWFVPHLLHPPAPVSAPPPKAPAVEVKQPVAAERIADAAPKVPTPAPTPTPEARKTIAPTVPRTAVIETLAGSGLGGVTPDGTPAREAVFQDLFRVAVDGQGNIFMTDFPANMIYRLSRNGIVSPVAGNARPGYDGEDTSAHDSRLNGPQGIRVRNGSIVFADTFNNRVREVTRDGRLRTLAGNGTQAYSGDGGRAVDAALNRPAGVGLDKTGSVYIADTGNHRIRKITAEGTILTVAGNGTAGSLGDGGKAEQSSLNGPRTVVVDSNGDLYIADMGNHRIRRVSAGVIATLAGDGQPGYSGDGDLAVNARLNSPGDLALSGDRQLYILDRPTHRIRRIDLVSGIITTFAGNGEGVASGDGGEPTKAGLGDPAGVAVDAAGNVYVTDRKSKQLRIIRPAHR